MATVAIAAEETSPDWNATTLTGDWGGKRSSAYNQGVAMEFTHKSDFMSNISGGIKKGTAWMGHTEARVKLDLQKLVGMDSASAYIHFHSDLGSKFNRDYVNAFVGVDNIETATNTAQLYNAWVQKNFSDDSLSVLFGLYPIDSEFYVTDTSGLFIQPPYGMANDLAQPALTASQAPAIFPTGALALRLKYTSPGKQFYVQYALSDGVPGDPNNLRGTHIQLNKGDGTLSIAEFGFTPQSNAPASETTKPEGVSDTVAHEESESFNKTAIGVWHYTAMANDLDSSVSQLRSNQGYYFLAERTLMTKKDHPAQGLSGFVRYGTASRDIHQADWTGSVGLRYHGLLQGRDDDIAGIAVTYNHASSKYQQYNPSANHQTQVEATYRAQVKPWFALQPTIQFFSHPNMDATRKDTWIVGTRADISF
jgi:porin